MSNQPIEFTSQDVVYLAKLARLALTPEEIKQYAAQLGEILAYVRKLQAITGPDVGAIEQEESAWRPDEVKPWAEVEELVSAAPESQDGLVVVPEVFADSTNDNQINNQT